MPDVHQEFVDVTKQLEKHYKDMQDIEFTIENGKLYLLQTRNGKRTAKAAIKIAVDLVHEQLITREEAVSKVEVKSIDQLLHPNFNEESLKQATVVSKMGLPASPGAATGKVVFSAEEAKLQAENGNKVVLMRPETSPEDIEGMVASEAIVTTHGGMTSHAAVVARGMGKCCVTGCSNVEIDTVNKTVYYPEGELHEGDIVSVDGSAGDLYLGAIETVNAEHSEEFDQFMTWSEEIARLQVRMNAETPQYIKAGYNFGSKGIGLVRTEHMFFGPERLIEMRRFILASNHDERVQALEKIKTYQVEDFETIFRLSQDRPTIVRLLDPPLHEFLPSSEEDINNVSQQLNVSSEFLRKRIVDLNEVNPMLGHRGCRLAVTYPELYEMQVEAIIESVIKLQKEGITCLPEIMIPLVSTVEEFTTLKERLVNTITHLEKESQQDIQYMIGTMIETPRACLIANDLAKHCDFFSFGTNDLTQLTFGFSRDDAGKFINVYTENNILQLDPFQTLDREGVGRLIQLAVEQANTNPEIKIGVCGELGGDAKSIRQFNQWGIDYVSCSPFRVPGAILATAQSQAEESER